MKYIVSYNTKFGTISAESKKPEDLVDVLSDLKRLESKLQSKGSKKEKNSKDVSRRKGTGETTVILSVIESKLLLTNFFSTPKTTGETADRLAKVSGKRFTSRKVSQALGILYEKGSLRRSGQRNSYAYSTG